MTDRPIIFSGPMVRALLEGRKSQTRRLLTAKSGLAAAHTVQKIGAHWIACEYDRKGPVRLPYAPGDRLYVREALQAVTEQDADGTFADCISYAADGAHPKDGLIQWPWQRDMVPSIHMPRWASRLTLTVTEVRVQRLQEISYLDTCAEGVDCETCAAMGQSACYRKGCGASREAFRALWNSLHGPDAWDANPWVVAVSFTVQHRNIDAA